MARDLIPVTYVSRFTVLSATSPVPVAANTTDGNLSPNDGYTILEVTNTSGASRDVSVDIPAGIDENLLAPDRVLTFPSNGVYLTGVFPVSTYGAQLLYIASGSGISFRALSMRGTI